MSEPLEDGTKVLVMVGARGFAKRAHVVYTRGESVRVRFDDGKERTVDRAKILGQRKAPRVPPVPRVPNIGRGRARAVPKAPTTSYPKHLELVRTLPCCICSKPGPSDPHHFGPRGMGQKTDDRRTVPICRPHHDEFHTTGRCAPYSRAETEREFYRAQVAALLLAQDRGIG